MDVYPKQAGEWESQENHNAKVIEENTFVLKGKARDCDVCLKLLCLYYYLELIKWGPLCSVLHVWDLLRKVI